MSLNLFRLEIYLLWAIIPVAYIIQGQDFNWDLQNYHIYNSISLFEGSFGADTAPAGIQSYFNPLVSVPAYLIHRVASTPSQSFWAGLVLAGFQGLCGPLIFGIARTLLQVSRTVAFLIAVYGISGSILLSESGTSFGDLTLCVLQLAAVYLISLSIRAKETNKQNLLLISWGILGSACGIKFSAIFVLPLLLMISLASLKYPKRPYSSIQFLKEGFNLILLPWLIGFVLFGWLWFSRSLVDNGNPFFPLFSSLFGESSIFFYDNHNDTRFLPTGLSGFLLAPRMEFIAVPMQRAEIAYRDLRPMLWIYGGCLSLIGLIAINLRGGIKSVLNFSPYSKTGCLYFQIGLLASYGIWLKSAGIARYAIPINALSGISLAISVMILANFLPGSNLDSNLTASVDPLKSRKFVAAFAALIALCIATQVVPNWGRTNFNQSWNSLRLIDRVNNGASENKPTQQVRLFSGNYPVILMNPPLGWLKQYAPRGTSFNLLSENLRPLAMNKIKATIKQNKGHFAIVDFVDKKSLYPNASITLLEGRLQFETKTCTDYATPTEIKLRICQAMLSRAA